MSFATLTPANALAKIAFNDVYSTIDGVGQGDSTDNIFAAHNMSIKPKQEYHQDVLRLRLEVQNELDGRSDSQSQPELDPDTENRMRHMGMLWTGHYVLQNSWDG